MQLHRGAAVSHCCGSAALVASRQRALSLSKSQHRTGNYNNRRVLVYIEKYRFWATALGQSLSQANAKAWH